MEYAKLGTTELMVSRLGYGCAAMGGYDYGPVSDRESERAVQQALTLGVNLFDTADVYGFGHAEEVLGRALGLRRDDVVIATKFGVRWDMRGRTMRDTSPAWVEQAVEGSLRRLGIECIPLYQMHWWDERTPMLETVGALRRLQGAGKIRHVGCCNADGRALDRMQQWVRLEALQLPYSLVERQWEAIIRHGARQHRVAVFSYNSLAQGLLTGKYGPVSRFEGADLRSRSALFHGEAFAWNLALLERVRAVAQRHHRTPAQVAIRWILDSPGVACALTGIKVPSQIDENVGGLHWTLPDDDRRFLRLDSLDTREGFGAVREVAGE